MCVCVCVCVCACACACAFEIVLLFLIIFIKLFYSSTITWTEDFDVPASHCLLECDQTDTLSCEECDRILTNVLERHEEEEAGNLLKK